MYASPVLRSRVAAASWRALLALTAAFGGGAPLCAWADTLEIQYGMSLAGLSIGTATLAGTVGNDAYRLDVKANLTGLASMMTSGRGAGIATGATVDGRVVPTSYALTSGGASVTYSVRMALAGGNVAGIDIAPPLEDRSDRVPVQDSHKRGVVDPVSALLMPVARGAALLDPASCNRTLPVFDGVGRFDVSLTYSTTRSVALQGYSGPVLVCAVRYTPISGHRAGRKATQFMADNRDIQVWLAPVENARALVPVKIAVRTMIGMTEIEAKRFKVTGADPAKGAAAASDPSVRKN